MKLALVNAEKVEATKGVKGTCCHCGFEVISKCGEERVHHWAHKGRRNCDPWWENETEWHRTWKNNFQKEWQEITHCDEISGEKHIADVKTGSGWVIEFQHSSIKPEERRSRNTYYPKLVWVVDGTKRQRDKPTFFRVLYEYGIKSDDLRFKRVIGQDDCKLIKDWHDSDALVFLDFQDNDDALQSILWFLFPKVSSGEAYLWPISRQMFIELHVNNKFDELVEKVIHPFTKKIIREEQMKIEAEEFRRRQEQMWISNFLRMGRF